jgi:predicted amidohydrolase YtcJ
MINVNALHLVPATLFLACAREPANPADLVLRNTVVYTVDSANPRAQAVAIDGGRITYVGSDSGVRAFVGRNTRVLDLAGRLVLPGFHDTHVHLVTGGIELGECNLNPAVTLDDVRRMVRECATRPTEWVRGGGFQLPIFPGGNPTRELLDSLVPDRPAYLSSSDGHSAWVNSRALAIAGVTRATRDPAKGRIERGGDGAPSGALRESAMELVSSKLPPRTADEDLAGLERGLAMAARFGITTIHEASTTEARALAFARADSLGRLSARSILSLLVDTDAPIDSEVKRLVALRSRASRGLVQPVAAKIFLDGVIEAQTGALLAPYVDRPGYRGELNMSSVTFNTFVQKLDSTGFKVHVHAIGDRAIRTALDGFEQQRARDGGAGPRHIVAHIQLFDEAEIPRFASLGVVASFQPLWAYADTYITDLTEPRLGPERSRNLYPIARVSASGAIMAAGSDWSVTSMNPLEAIQVAVTRRALDDSTGDAWLPNERVDLATMLRAYTLGGAIASDHDSLTGSITVGKAADLIVVSEDLFATPVHRIGKAGVLLTLLNGREVYRDSTVRLREDR